MFGDLIYGVFMISVLYISADLMKKYKKGDIKNNADLAMYFAKKSFKAVKIYNRTRKNTNKLLNKCLKNKTIKQRQKRNTEEIYKLVCMSDSGDMYKALVIYTENDVYLKKNNHNISEILKNDSKPLMLMFNKEKTNVVQINVVDFDITNKEKMLLLKNKIDNIEHDEKLFVNVQCTLGEDYDITDAMKKYYCEGNKIFSREFMNYFMLEYYNKEINDEYVLSVMDKNIVMESIKNTQYIDILKEDDEIIYKIRNIE
jgi:hypothetical protein